MKVEELKALGLDDDTAKKVFALHGKTVTSLKDAHKVEVDTLTAQATDLKSQLDNAKKTLDGLKPEDLENAKAEIKEWKEKHKQLASESEARVAKLQRDHAVEKALAEAGVQDNLSVMPHLDQDLIKVDGTGIKGLSEQLATLKEKRPYLFKATEGGEGDENPGQSQAKSPQYTTPNPTPPKTTQSTKFSEALLKGAGMQK